MIEVLDLAKWFGSEHVLKGVSISIRRGEFFSLLGPSGCGKTTLLRIIGGFETASRGDVLIDGESVLGISAQRRRTNMVFQHLALFPHMSVQQNIAFGLEMRRLPRDKITAKVRDALALVRLEGLEHRGIDELSGGQKQRVAIARALVNEPKVLLLDEPLGALDLQLRLQMQSELQQLQKSLGSTFIFVTHDQSEAMTMSDRIAVMDKGEILQVGTPRAIYEAPEHRFVAEFIGHSNFFQGTVVSDSAPDGITSINCNGRIMQGKCRSAPSPGTPATISLRYEKILLSCAPGADSWKGSVSKITFTGPAVRAEVSLPDDLLATVELSAGSPAASLSVGQTVGLSWSPENANVLLD